VEKPSTKPEIITRAQEDAWFALLFTHATVTARIDAVLMEQHRISFSAFEILCRLEEQEPQPVRVLAGQLVSVSPTRASRLMQDLVDDGYLQRDADQGDGRVRSPSTSAGLGLPAATVVDHPEPVPARRSGAALLLARGRGFERQRARGLSRQGQPGDVPGSAASAATTGRRPGVVAQRDCPGR
jgi:hypothetical protein